MLLGYPLAIFSDCIVLAPYVIILWAMITASEAEGWSISIINFSVREIVLWFTQPQRLKYFVLLRIAEVIQPLIYMSLTIIIKRNIVGKFTECEGESRKDEWRLFQQWIMVPKK